MATRMAVARVVGRPAAWVARMEGMAGAGRLGGGAAPRYFSDRISGRVLSEEERAKENVYIQKMEREKLEKLRRKADKDKAEAAKRAAEANKGDKKGGEEAHPS